MVFKAINDSISLNGFIFILLVFGAYLRMIESNALFSTITQRVVVMQKAVIEVRKIIVSKQVKNALNT